jgi:hypothetical protein
LRGVLLAVGKVVGDTEDKGWISFGVPGPGVITIVTPWAFSLDLHDVLDGLIHEYSPQAA